MVSWILAVTVGLAFLSGPSAFLLLWLTWRKTRGRGLVSLALCLVGLFFILVGNTVTLLCGTFGPWWDVRMGFLTMTAVFLATVMTGGFLARFSHEITEVPIGQRRAAFWVFTILFFFLVQSLPLFLDGPQKITLENGYLTATLYGALCQIYATVLIVRYRHRVPPLFAGTYVWFFLGLAVLGVLSVSNDVFHFGRFLHGPDLPFSPLFFLLVNGSIVFLCGRELLRAPAGTPGTFDAGYTEREREIVPLLLDGLSNDQIAERLFISAHTVKNHVTAIYRKAGVSNRLELLKKTSVSPS